MDASHIDRLLASRTIKGTSLSFAGGGRGAAMDKFEARDQNIVRGPRLPESVHNVNVFTTTWLKNKRWLIT